MARRVIYSILLLISLLAVLLYFDVLWKSPSYYRTETKVKLNVPIMDMKVYMEEMVSNHRRPYIYNITSKSGGKVIVIGTDHVNNPDHIQFDSIRYYWKKHKPTVALVEGRLGFFFSWIHNPIKKYGESGLTSELSKKNNAALYTWEPSREDEIEILIEKYSAKKLAMFYSLRPFFQLPKKERNIDNLKDLIEERTDYKYLKNSIINWQEIDSIWKVDFPKLNWKTYNSNYGYPGYLHDIWNSSNLARDKHMIDIILEQIKEGETVFVTMGASHAPRIEKTLNDLIK